MERCAECESLLEEEVVGAQTLGWLVCLGKTWCEGSYFNL